MELLKSNIIDWSSGWGLSLAYAITRNFDQSERIVSEVAVGLMTADSLRSQKRLNPDQDTGSVLHALKFAHAVYELASKTAFRLLTDESFYRLSPLARAVCILKMKARFSVEQIATVLEIEVSQVELHLENARMLFSSGRPWTDSSASECPYWTTTTPYADSLVTENASAMFAKYIEGDLDQGVSISMNSHLAVCVSCRENLARFKDLHTSFAATVPQIELSDAMKKYLPKFLNQTTQLILDPRPTFIGSLEGLARDRSFQLGVAIFVVVFALLTLI